MPSPADAPDVQAALSPPGAPALTDEEVVTRVLRGEVALFEVLMRRYNRRLYRVARAIVGDPAEAEDVMQESYVRAFAALATYEGRAPWATWLTRIAVNEGLARVRRRGRFVARDAIGDAPDAGEDDLMSTEQPPAGGPLSTSWNTRRGGPEGEAALRELTGVIERAVDSLPDTYRSVFMLREVEEMSTAETAACLEVSEELVKVRLHRARAELRRRLDRQLGEASREAFEFAGVRCDRVVAGVLARIGRRDGAR